MDILGIKLGRSRITLLVAALSLAPLRVLPYSVVPFLAVHESQAADARQSRETQLKAAFFYKFRSFIEWDEAHARNPDAPALCILGLTAVTEFVEALAAASPHPLTVKQTDSAEESRECALVFVADFAPDMIKEILQTLDGSGAVTVSDVEGFALWGGMIELVREGPHVRFFINQSVADRQGVRVSSQLMALSKRPG